MHMSRGPVLLLVSIASGMVLPQKRVTVPESIWRQLEGGP